MRETGVITTYSTIDSSHRSFSSPESLLRYLHLDSHRSPYSILSQADFPFKITRSYASKIKKGDWFDPLLLQCLPRAEESAAEAGYTEDPVGDHTATVIPGLIHKYANRVLLTLSPECSIHCRYCFRKNYAYHGFSRSEEEWYMIWNYIQSHPEITEVILSGGDPLTVSNQQLHEILDAASLIPHVRTLRIHSRIPSVSPQRITLNLLRMLTEYQEGGLSMVMVHHINHPREIGQDNGQIFDNIRKAGIIQLNQSVLLHKVNDNSRTLTELSQALIRHGIMPYYLHHLDKVRGSHHFYVPQETGKQIIREMTAALQGYGVPRFVTETAGTPSKIHLC